MSERQEFVRQELDRLFREWSSRTALLGALIFLALSALDFYSVPEHAWGFLGLRVGVAALLTGCAAFVRRASARASLRLAVFAAVLASTVALELMILDYGGHRSPYLIGQILLAVIVSGLIPGGAGFAALLNATIYLVYLVPILLWDEIADPAFFTVSCVLLLCVLGAGVLIRWFHMRHLVREILLRRELTESRERLEREVARHSQTDSALRESREFLASITSAAMDAIVMIDPAGAIRYWNPAATGIFGYDAEETIGRAPFTFLIDPALAGELLERHRGWLAKGPGLPPGLCLVSKGLRKDGESFPLELAMAAVKRGDGLWTCALLTDISERTRNEDRLRLFAAAVDNAAEGISILDLDGKILYVNPATARQTGRPATEIAGLNIRQLLPSHADLEKTILPTLLREGHWAGEILIARASGTAPLWLTASIIRNDAGLPIAMICLTRDLSEQKRLEAEHIRAQKLESISVLAGGLAHDFNNLLTIILGNLDLARLFVGANPDASEALDHAGEAAQRAGDLTRQLITFSKGGHPVKRIGNIARVVRSTVAFAAAGSPVGCEFDLPEDLPAVEFDEGQMHQVIHNLVQNAREAMPGGGTLRVAACTAAVAEGEVLGLPGGHYVRLEFADCGGGIAREHLSLIFDPYFSTKELDTIKGRGLGLAVSFSIVRNHGGTITAESHVGKGTTFAIYLPEAQGTADEEDPPEPEDESEPPADFAVALEAVRLPDGPIRGRVLVMDDEPLVLEMAGAALRRLGYAVTLCRSGAEAIVQYQIALDAGRRFDAVILDLTVPGEVGGPEALTRLRTIDPRVRAALSSGYTDHPSVRNWREKGFAGFIAKPYSIKALEEWLDSLP